MAENKACILSTRKLQNEAVNNRGGQNWLVEEFPFIRIIPDESENTRALVHKLAQQQYGVIFTSVNTVNIVTRYLKSAPEWKIFCIAGATKNTLLQLFKPADILAAAKNAILLSDEIIACSSFRELVFFCGNRRLNELPVRLAAAGIRVKEVEVYKTVLTPVRIEKEYKAILFFSPSAAHSFFSINTLPEQTVLFSIGESTTAALSAYCSNKILTSTWPSESILMQMVTDYYT